MGVGGGRGIREMLKFVSQSFFYAIGNDRQATLKCLSIGTLVVVVFPFS